MHFTPDAGQPEWQGKTSHCRLCIPRNKSSISKQAEAHDVFSAPVDISVLAAQSTVEHIVLEAKAVDERDGVGPDVPQQLVLRLARRLGLLLCKMQGRKLRQVFGRVTRKLRRSAAGGTAPRAPSWPASLEIAGWLCKND